jgi:uncharacterized membrane protein
MAHQNFIKLREKAIATGKLLNLNQLRQLEILFVLGFEVLTAIIVILMKSLTFCGRI